MAENAVIGKDREIVVSESELPVLVQENDLTALPNPDDVFEEYRAYVRKIQCVVCQLEIRNTEDRLNVNYEPELLNVSDPHHVMSRGAGGPDAENIVPLCRKHHNEFGNIGINSFELKYNVSLKRIAEHLFEIYMGTIMKTDTSKVAYASHQQLLSKVDGLRLSVLEIGILLWKMRDEKIDGKYMWETLGFDTFKHYTMAPVRAGGLDMAIDMVRRCIAYANVYAYVEDENRTEAIGISKAKIILPMLRKAKTEAEIEQIITVAETLTYNDLLEWRKEFSGNETNEHKLMNIFQLTFTQLVKECGGTPDKEKIYNAAFFLVNDVISKKINF